MFIDTINKSDSTNYFKGCNIIFICDTEESQYNKIVNFPSWLEENFYDDDCNFTFKICFKNGCSTSSPNYILLNGNPIMIQVNNIRNVSGNNFINLPYHQITENGVTSYVTLQKNTILELYFNKDEGCFTVINNPIVISSNDYCYFANGNKTGYMIKRIYDGTCNANTSYTLPDSNDGFYNWDFIIPITCMYGSQQQTSMILTRIDIHDGISPSANDYYVACDSTGATGRRIAYKIRGYLGFHIDFIDGTSGNMPHFYGFYGVRFNLPTD